MFGTTDRLPGEIRRRRIEGGGHPERHLAGYAGLMQDNAYADFGKAHRKEAITQAACWA